MNIRPIKTESDYEAALERVAALMDAAPNSPDGDELDVLATLVGHYESQHCPIEPANLVEAILFRMEPQGLTRKDLEPLLGSRHRVSEVLNRRRGLSLEMIRRLHEGLQIPLENLAGCAAQMRAKFRHEMMASPRGRCTILVLCAVSAVDGYGDAS